MKRCVTDQNTVWHNSGAVLWSILPYGDGNADGDDGDYGNDSDGNGDTDGSSSGDHSDGDDGSGDYGNDGYGDGNVMVMLMVMMAYSMLCSMFAVGVYSSLV